MQLWRRKRLFHWHKKTSFALFSTHWSLGVLASLCFGILIYFLISLGSIRFFLTNYFQIAGLNNNYLIILQNNSELRPTGGFISAYGILKFRFFLPVSFEIKDSFSISKHEYIEPPQILGKMLKDPWYAGHTFRDANWNPDFATSSQALIQFFNLTYPQTKINGTISLNYQVIENLVAKIPPFQIQDTSITQNNLFHFLEYKTKDIDKHNLTALTQRKNILKDLGQNLIQKSILHIPTVAQIFTQALREKEIQLWFKNPKLETKIKNQNWDGNFKIKSNQDSLGIVLANLGSKKSDRYLQKNIDYIVHFQTNKNPEVILKITITHHGDYSLVSDKYKGYLRIYIPSETIIQSSSVISAPSNSREIQSSFYEENNAKVIGQEIYLNPGETQTYTFQYELPPSLLQNNQYILKLLKQSGTQDFYNIILKVDGDLSFETSDFKVKENRAFFHSELKTDQTLKVKFLPDTTPPLIYNQKFDKLNQIAIFWNEPLDPLNANEIENFEIKDLNQTNQKTDTIKIKKAEYDGHTIIKLFTEGITKQNLEHYQISIKNIQDRFGNYIFPEVKTITAIQRFDK